MNELSPQNSEIILYRTEDGHTRIEVKFKGETAWLSLNQMAELFQRDKSVISKHIRNVFAEGELTEDSTVANFATVQKEGSREVAREIEFYNAEIIQERANAALLYMGLTSWSGDKPRKYDVSIAKNYLNQEELEALNRIVTAYLEFAEVQALNRRPMYMRDWIAKLDDFLKLGERDILTHAGNISHELAVEKAETEYLKYHSGQSDQITRVEKDFLAAAKKIEKLKLSK
jgi:hypothetical protein